MSPTQLKVASWINEGRHEYGLVEGNEAIELSSQFTQWTSLGACLSQGGFLDLLSVDISKRRAVPLHMIELTMPVPDPGKIICVGVNYPDRNAEYKDNTAAPPNPSLFVRFKESFVGHGRPIILPRVSEQLDYEGEIALVIGKGGRHINEENALEHIAALTLCNEGTVRDWVTHAKFNVTQGKNFESSGSMGPWMVPFGGAGQLSDIALRTWVNGDLRQSDRTSRMIFSPAKLISYISTFARLNPSDIILTGTPTGAGARMEPPQWLKPGDTVEVKAEGIGCLRNRVEAEAEAWWAD